MMRVARVAWALALCTSVGGAALSCGGAAPAPAAPSAPTELAPDQIDADPVALLPGSMVAAADVDARAFFASGVVGAQVAAMVESQMPVGDEAGFRASRDVDRVVAAAYSIEGVDVAAVLVGRFDAKKIGDAAAGHVAARGGPIVASEYDGHAVYTVANVGIAVLTPKTALVGTEAALRRALDRVHAPPSVPLHREPPPWMLETLGTPNASAALAADFATQSLASAGIGSVAPGWLKEVKQARVLTDFKPPGFHVAGTLTFASPETATRAANGLNGLARIAGLAARFGAAPQLRDFSARATGADVQCSFALDEAGMRKTVGTLPRFVH
jgi:hypothetical protein